MRLAFVPFMVRSERSPDHRTTGITGDFSGAAAPGASAASILRESELVWPQAQLLRCPHPVVAGSFCLPGSRRHVGGDHRFPARPGHGPAARCRAPHRLVPGGRARGSPDPGGRKGSDRPRPRDGGVASPPPRSPAQQRRTAFPDMAPARPPTPQAPPRRPPRAARARARSTRRARAPARAPPPSPREWWPRPTGASTPPAGAQAPPCACQRAHRATAATQARRPRRPAPAHRARPAPPRHQHDRPLRPDDRASGPVVPGGPRPTRPTYPTGLRPARHRSREPQDLEVAPGQSQKGRAVAEYATDRWGRGGAAGSGRPQLAED
jgi:hypothetical protein